LTKATAGVSYPAGYRAWRNWVLLESADPKLGETLKEACGNGNQRQIEHWPRDAPALESIPVFRGEVAQSAFCAWASEWLSAKRSGDNVAASRAAGEIAGAIPWPAPNKDAERNRVSWFVPVQQAVRTDDLETVASMWAHKGRAPQVYQCWVYQPAPNSDNGTVFVRKPDVLKPGPHA
jgi:hypothetical protein